MSFTFTGTAAAGTSANPGAISGGVTPWYRISDRVEASSLILSGTFVATIQIEYSNVAEFDKGSDYAIDALAITTPTLREIPLGAADYVRGRCIAFTSGTPKLSFARAVRSGGAPYTIPEDTKKTPPPSSAGS